MAEKPASEKTEQPTGKRISDARQKGQSPQSAELMSFMSILVLLVMLTFQGPVFMEWFSNIIREGMSCNTAVFTNNSIFVNFINRKIIDFVGIILPIVTALCIGGVVGGVVVSGWNYSPGALKLKFSVLNPITGFGNLINARSMVKLLMSIVKLFFVSIIVWLYLQDKMDALIALRWAWSVQILSVIGRIILGLMIRVCIALLVIGISDVIYQKWKYTQDLKMTKEEVKEERKQSEGPPEIKQRIRKIQIQMAAKRMLQEIPKASVVLVNPTHVAVVLRYDAKKMEAPLLTAKGADHLAEKIREIARAYGVPIIRRPELARTIFSTVELDQAIPDTLYVAVAEVMALIHRLRHRTG